MEKLKQYKYIILVALIILGASFYWFHYRPGHIEKIKNKCWGNILLEARKNSNWNNGIDENGKFDPNLYLGDRSAYRYEKCLRENGVK